MELKERVGQLLKDKKVTPYEVAVSTGLSHATISRILSGKTLKLSIGNGKLLADYFHLSYEWLTTGIGEMTFNTLKPDVLPTTNLPSTIESERLKWKIEEQSKLIEDQKQEIRTLLRENGALKEKLEGQQLGTGEKIKNAG